MKQDIFYPGIAGVLLVSAASAMLVTVNTSYSIFAGIGTVGALAMLRYVERDARRHGKNDRMKIALKTTTVLYELLLLVAAFSLPVVPKYLAAIVLAAVAFSEILRLELVQELRTSHTPDLGRDGRILVLASSFVAYSFNSYFMFYGILTIGLIAVYDSLKFVHQLRQKLWTL